MTNQYAAMPSLHVGWALWCAVLLWRHGGTHLARTAGVLYALVTTIVVMGTANHYFLDAVAGAAVMGVGLLLVRPVMRLADRARTALKPASTPVVQVSPAVAAPIVSGECQTSAGERIPRQRKDRVGQVSRPSAGAGDAGDGTPAAAR